MEEALFISRFASKVIVVHRREEFRASPIMVDRARSSEKIEFVLNTVVEEVLGDGKVTGVRVGDTVTGGDVLDADGVFVAIGHDPNTALFLDQLDHEPDTGYLLTRGKSTETKSPVSSPRAMFRTTPTARRSRRGIRLRSRRSTPSAG